MLRIINYHTRFSGHNVIYVERGYLYADLCSMYKSDNNLVNRALQKLSKVLGASKFRLTGITDDQIRESNLNHDELFALAIYVQDLCSNSIFKYATKRWEEIVCNTEQLVSAFDMPIDHLFLSRIKVSAINSLISAGIVTIGMLFKNSFCSRDYKYGYSRSIVSCSKVKYSDILEVYNKLLAIPKEYSDFAVKTLQEKMEAELRVIRKNKYESGLEAYQKSINEFK